MAKKAPLDKAQVGRSVPNLPQPSPSLSESFLESKYGGYTPSYRPMDTRGISSPNVFVPPQRTSGIGQPSNANNVQSYLDWLKTPDDTGFKPKAFTLDEFKAAQSGRYENYLPGYDVEEAYAIGQSGWDKAFNGVLKGTSLAATTFVNSTVGLVYGLGKWIQDGEFSSFYDNELTRALDDINRSLEDKLPNYYTQQEKNAKWYSPDYFFTGNFLWDGVVKNLGFAAGAALSGAAFTKALQSIPVASRLFAAGKAGETLAATESAIASGGKAADTYGKLLEINKQFASGYNNLNRGGRAVVAGLATSGEASIEALHNKRDFEDKLSGEFEKEFGYAPVGEDLENIKAAAKGVGSSSYAFNVGLLGISNYIQFPRILGSSYKAEKNIVNGLVREIDDIAYEGGKYVAKQSKYPFLSKLNKIRPYTFSVTEALEESGQFSVSVGTEDYYNKMYKGEDASFLSSFKTAITDGLFSDEGAKNALIGGISGRIMTAGIIPGQQGMIQQARAKRKNTAEAIAALNEKDLKTAFSSFTKETFQSVARGTVLQEEKNRALKDGNVEAFKNLEADEIINYLTPRIKYGRYDFVKAEIADYKKLALTQEGFAQLQAEGIALDTDTQESFVKRLDAFAETADNISTLWQSLNLRYGNEVLTDQNGDPILTKDGKRVLKYSPDVMNKLIYSAAKVTDFDKRINQLTSELSAAGINIADVIQSVEDAYKNTDQEPTAFNEAVQQLKDSNRTDKDDIGEKLDALPNLIVARNDMLGVYEDIKQNPLKYFEQSPLRQDRGPKQPSQFVKVKDIEVGVGGNYYTGKINEEDPISEFTVDSVNNDGSINITTENGLEKTISAEKFKELNPTLASDFEADDRANFYYYHKDEVFEYNFGKNLGGRKRGKLEYDNGKLYFTYLTPKGKEARKEVNGSYFAETADRPIPRIVKLGGTETLQQRRSRTEFTSVQSINNQRATLSENRDSRLEVITELGNEAQESLNEINKKLDKHQADLAKIKEDLRNIQKMQADPKSERIKLNFSKATKSFTKALNNLTSLQKNIEDDMANLNLQKDELQFAVSYFQDLANEIGDMPGDSGEFLQELKNQVSLLIDNGKNLNKALAVANKLKKDTEKAVKSFAKMFRGALKSKYKVEDDYSQYLNDLLDQLVSGENIETVWPLLKEEMANFALTNDLSQEATITAPAIIEALNGVEQVEKDIADLQREYKARQAVIDRFQKIADEYATKKAEEEKLLRDIKATEQLLSTEDKGVALDDANQVNTFEADSKKADNIVPIATKPVSSSELSETDVDKPHQIRANRFGINLPNLPKKVRDGIRGVFVTYDTQSLVVPAENGKSVIDLMLEDVSEERLPELRSSSIVMLMVDKNGNPVDENGNTIPNGETLLDKIIFQPMPNENLTNRDRRTGATVSMFRDSASETRQTVIKTITSQYKNWRDGVIEEGKKGNLSPRVTIAASFGQPTSDNNNFTPVEDAGLISSVNLEKDNLIFIPKFGEPVITGEMQYTAPSGGAFLILPDGKAAVRLKNRKHTEEEANVIADAIIQLSKNRMEIDGMQSSNSKAILSFLQSVVYWGIPTTQEGKVKRTSTNSVFFIKDPKDGILKLILSNDGTSYKFTPSELQENREAIVAKLSDMYNNATAAKLGDINEEFVQITSVSEDGKIESVTWPNYQTYLLSNKNNKGKGSRTNPPLAVVLDPDNGVDMNRKGVYFYRTDSSDDFTSVEQEAVETAEAQQGPRNIPLAKTTYVFDGTTENIYQTEENTIPFTVADNVNDKNYVKTITILDGGTVAQVIEKVQKSKGLSLEEATNLLKFTIYNNILPQILEREQAVSLEDQVVGLDDEVESKAENIAGKPIDNDVKPKVRPKSAGRNRESLRVAIENTSKMFEPENWTDVESWLKQNFPNVPVYRVKNIIQATNGRQAWGMFKDGAIYVYENAEVGTTYHEVFEAVYSMFVDANEKTKLNEEFKSRTGTFIDRPTGRTVKYSEATPAQIKEQLAEEFRDYIQYKKIPPKPKGKNFITRLFADIKSFIEKFFTGRDAQSNTEELFAKIGEGYYAKNMPYARQLSLAQEGILDINNVDDTSGAEFRLKVNERQRDDVINEMVYLTLLELTKSNATLFEASKLDKEFFEDLQEGVYATIDNFIEVALEEENEDLAAELLALKQNIKDEWPEISKLYREKILQYDVVFDEEDSLVSEDRGRGDTYQEATKIDHFRKARKGIKLLISTLPVMDRTVYAQSGTVEEKASSIGGAILMSQGQVYATLMEKLHDSVSPSDMMKRLRNLAEDDINYRSLYKRVAKRSYVDKSDVLTNLTEPHDLQVITGLWSMVKKQNPSAKNVILFEDGTSTVANSAMSTVADQIRQKYLNSIISLAKSGKGLFTYNKTNNTYTSNKDELKKYTVVNTDTQFKFLEAIGIPFTAAEMKTIKVNDSVLRKFDEAARAIYNSLSTLGNLKYLSSSELNISNRLLEIAEVKAAINNPNRNSTFFIAGERRQSYIGVNALSELSNYISKVANRSDLANSPYAYLLTDTFSKNSNVLNRMFASDGSRKSTKRDLLGIGYLGELIDNSKNKQKTPGRFTFKERLVSMLNLQQKGIFPVLVPGDASLEYTAEMGTPISTNNLDSILSIFKGYFLSEVDLSREGRPIAEVEGRNSTDLRFFKDILGDSLHSDIVSDIQKDETISADAIFNKYEDKINDALTQFILDKVADFRTTLEAYKVIEENVEEKTGTPLGTYKMEGVAVAQNLAEDALTDILIANQANYMIANIEIHKLLFSDPYQYEGDELKRIKSFLSPRESLSNSIQLNNAFNQVWNEGFEKGDIGYTNFTQGHFNTASHKDIKVINDLPGHKAHKETDGSGIIAFKSHRNFRIRIGQWNQEEEKQYRYEVAWEKRDKGLELSKEDQDLLKEGNPQVKSAFTPSKPIVSGAKLGYTYNNVVLDKFALYPLSYRVMKEINPESNLVKLYNKMQNENIDYIVFESGRKVGAESSHATYNEDGSFNDAEYAAVVKIPFNIISLQQDVPSKAEAQVVRATQPTKLVTLDYLDNGIPEDFETGKDINDRYVAWMQLSEAEKYDYPSGTLGKPNLYKEVKNNQELLDKMSELGYEGVLKRLGIVENGDGTYQVKDFSSATKTLREELFKRETNNNISKALDDFLAGKSNLEITPAYQPVRNILYSIVDKQIIRPRVSGGQKVQIPSALFESNRVAQTEINGKKGYTSDILKFYEDADGKRVMEVMVGRWFESDMSDKELLDYLNNTEEGQKILSGFAFRIPTQAQNSIDAIRIKQFLPKEFGDSVVVPASIVEKVGSDFDIDKLFMYLKNVYTDKSGNPKMIPFYGLDEKVAKKKFAEMYDRGELLTKNQMDKIKDKMAEKPVDLTQELTDKMIVAIFGEKFDKDQAALEDYLANTTSEDIKSKIVDKAFAQSVENEYVQSLENLVTNPLNFKRLIRPNSAAQLEKIANDIAVKVYGESFDYSNVGNMLDPGFMYRLRQAFLSGKKGIGIAATNQVFKSQLQKIPVVVDVSKIKNLRPQDRSYIGDGVIRFKEYNTITIDGEKMASLSGVTNAKGDLISNINGQFIDGYVDISNGPWIILMGASPNVTSTFLFLNNLGVPIDEVAYFMNQPIIRDYLELIDANGYSWLFIDNYVKDIKNRPAYKIEPAVNTKFKTIPDNLLDTVGKKNLNTLQRAQQHFMLDEFLKYAKMASQAFTLNQGVNWDTSRFNDPLLITRKQVKLEEARNTIFSTPDGANAADAIINNTFLGRMVASLEQSRNALGSVLPSDEQGSNIRNTIDSVIEPYARNIFSEDDYIKVARKLVADVFDYAVQTNENLNTEIQSILLDKNGVAAQAQSFIYEVLSNQDHPLHDNLIIRSLEVSPSREVGNTPNNLMIGASDNKTYDQNNIIYSFRELRDYLEGRTSLYDDIVQLSILQSGVSPSPISFTSLIPYEDVERIYGKVLSNLGNISNLPEFKSLGVFERNNWRNSDIVPQEKARWIKNKEGEWVYNPQMQYLPNAYQTVKAIAKQNKETPYPEVISISSTSRSGNSDYVFFSWDKNISKAKKKEMRDKGDFSYINKGLFQKIKDADGNPIVSEKGYFYYKQINAWGDGLRAKEFYPLSRQSVIDNGTLKVENEMSDESLAPLLSSRIQKSRFKSTPFKTTPFLESTPAQPTITARTLAMQPDNVSKILSGEKTTTLRTSNLPSGIYDIGGQQFNLSSRGLLSIEEAGGVEAITKSEAFAKTGPKFESTKKFLAGERKLYVIDITPVTQPTQQNKPEGLPAIDRTSKKC